MFFTHTYFQKIQTTLLEQQYQTGSKFAIVIYKFTLILFFLYLVVYSFSTHLDDEKRE